MPQTTALTLITGAFNRLNVFMPGQTIPARNANDGLSYLNTMMSSWKQITQRQAYRAREVFALVGGKGGPSNPYTIGPGGDFNTVKPASQNEIVGCGLLIGGTNPQAEIPRAILTDDADEAIQIKELANPGFFTAMYYNPTYSNDLGTIELWPVPSNADNSLVLYRTGAIAAFTSLQATVYVPDGAEDAIYWDLAFRMAPSYGRTFTEDMKLNRRLALQNFDRANLKLSDLPQDLAFSHSMRYGYNIQTGTGGGGGS